MTIQEMNKKLQEHGPSIHLQMIGMFVELDEKIEALESKKQCSCSKAGKMQVQNKDLSKGNPIKKKK